MTQNKHDYAAALEYLKSKHYNAQDFMSSFYNEIQTALKRAQQAQEVDVEELKKWTDIGGQEYLNMYQKGWNDCIDYLHAKGYLTKPEKESE